MKLELISLGIADTIMIVGSVVKFMYEINKIENRLIKIEDEIKFQSESFAMKIENTINKMSSEVKFVKQNCVIRDNQ